MCPWPTLITQKGLRSILMDPRDNLEPSLLKTTANSFFSRKLSVCQQKYSVTESELLAIVETLKEFKGMQWGQQIVVYTDHKNLMQDALGLTCDRVSPLAFTAERNMVLKSCASKESTTQLRMRFHALTLVQQWTSRKTG
eukprot:CCRYP_021247-RA/>CCRYP_021247-RA protein AED:0.41 eAED:0.41 QI:0/-1/0/1/-1/1/1/0/139